MIDCGIKPMYVFDGKPPDLKAKVLQGRYGRREEAREEEEEEKDIGQSLPQAHAGVLSDLPHVLSQLRKRGQISLREDKSR